MPYYSFLKLKTSNLFQKCDIDLSKLVHTRLEYLEELFALKQIELFVKLDIPLIIPIHPMLADILINNLFEQCIET